MHTNIKTNLNLFFLSVTILGLLMFPIGIYFSFQANKVITSSLVGQVLIWTAFSAYTIFFIKRYLKTKKG